MFAKSNISRARLGSGAVLIASGLALLLWVLWPGKNTASIEIQRVVVEEAAQDDGTMAAALAAGGSAESQALIQRLELRAEGFKDPLAEFHLVASPGMGPVLLDWKNLVSEPVFSPDVDRNELLRFAEALRKHLPPDSMILSWWDTGRRLRLLTKASVRFDQHLSEPVLIPEIWTSQKSALVADVNAFWSASNKQESQVAFDAFVAALLSDWPGDMSDLRRLSGDGPAYLVLHLTDAYKMGSLNPSSFGIGYKDFPNTGQSHGVMKRVKDWLAEEGYESYAVQPRDQESIRVYFLTDTKSSETMIAKLLPFTTSNPMQTDGAKLVFQHGGYWIYELDGGGKEVAKDK